MPISTAARQRPQVLRGGPVRPLWAYLRHSRIMVALSAPLTYLCALPFLVLDLSIFIYQYVCFPIYGIPRVRRRRFLTFDRGKLPYLNLLERFNCIYCSYANGVIAYVAEVAARTEQHWCPIKHAQPPGRSHERYARFVRYGDARAYRDDVEKIRRDFSDLTG